MIRSLRLIIAVFFLTQSSICQKIDFSQGIVNQKNYYAEVNFEIVLQKIVVPVTINNKEYKFLLDTGAPNVISNALFSELQLQSKKNVSVSDANNKEQEMSMVAVNSLKIDNLSFENTAALVIDLENHPLLKCYKIDGFIGSNLLQNSIIKINLKDKKIIITDNIKNLITSVKPSKLKLVNAQKSPFIKLELVGTNGKKGTEMVLFDTGMDGFYDLSNRANAVFNEEEIVTTLANSTGASDIGLFGIKEAGNQQLVQINKLEVNGVSFENIITETTDDDNSRIGLDLLKHGDVILDFKNKKFYFEATNNVVFDKKPPTLSLTFKDGKIVVGHVWSKEYYDKIQFGDEIIRLGDHNLIELNVCEILAVRNKLKSNKSREVEILRKDNTTLVLNLEN